MNKVTIDRELLPCPFCGSNECSPNYNEHRMWVDCDNCGAKGQTVSAPSVREERGVSEAKAIRLWNTRAAPRQPEGEGLEGVESLHVWRATNRFGDTCHFGDAGCARVWAGAGGKVDRIELKPVPELYDVNHADAAEVSATEIKVVAWAHCADATRLLCDLGKQRSVPGHYADEFTIPLCRLSDHQRAIAELRQECERLRSECARLESKYERDVWGLNNEGDPIGGDSPSGFANDLLRVTIERDTLRQQLAERDAEIERLRVKLMTIASAEPGRHNIEWAKAMAATGNND